MIALTIFLCFLALYLVIGITSERDMIIQKSLTYGFIAVIAAIAIINI